MKLRQRRPAWLALFSAGLTFAVLPGTAVNTAEPVAASVATSVKLYQIVPCLLPARVRRLGNMTYPERRKLIETPARECELKGGEYTFYDRAQPDAAAGFFRKLADDGDADAQLSLGDVYQYLYSPPRHAEAAVWYAKAAEAGNATAKMQLARLHERGLGVAKDGLLAVNLWREATGSGEELVLASEVDAVRTVADERIAQLTAQLEQRSEEAAEARTQLSQAQQEISKRKAALASAEQSLQSLRSKVQTLGGGGDPAELTKLRTQIASQQQTIDDQRFQIDSLEGELGVQEAQLAANLRQVESQNKRLEEELARVNAGADEKVNNALATLGAKDGEVKRLSAQLEALRQSAGDSNATVAALDRELTAARAEAARNQDARQKLVVLEKRLAEQTQTLAARKNEVVQLEQALAAASAESTTLRSRLDDQVSAGVVAQAEFARVEAELARSREALVARDAKIKAAESAIAALTTERTSLNSRLAAGVPAADSAALKADIALRDSRIREQQQTIAALRRDMDEYKGQIAEINLRRQAYASRAPVAESAAIRLPQGVKLGRFHSLVIGNDQYHNLVPLANARSDATAMHQVLRDNYGFSSSLLLDADRMQMFRAIGDLATRTGPDDLVLIYYAGHGVSTREISYWLPVDISSRQEAPGLGVSSDEVANWIKNIPARHVMVIADSCYSGAGIAESGGTTFRAADVERMLPFLIRSRSRTMLTSGGDGPVLDGGGGGQHSVFTRELLGVLRENQGILYGAQIFGHLRERVKFTVDGDAINQTPTFGSIERAGHESGQFVFVNSKVKV